MTNEDNGAELYRILREMERSLLGSESNTSEEQDDMIESEQSANHNNTKWSPRQSRSSRANTKRKREGKEELNELIEEKSVPKAAKILNDRLDRLKVKDMIEDMESHIYIQTVVMANNADNLFKPIVDSYDQIKRQWPARSDLEKIREKIKLIKSDETMEEREKKQRLKAIGEEITRLKEQREKDSKKVNDLEEYFTNPGVSVETLREKLSSACPWLDLGEIATNGPTADQAQGSLQNLLKFS